LKDYLKKKGIRLGIIVLAVVLIVAISARTLGGKAGFLANTAGVVRAPVQKAVTALADWMEGIYGYLYEYDQLKAENESLRIQLAEAQEQARAGADALEENERMRELLNLLQALGATGSPRQEPGSGRGCETHKDEEAEDEA
jgi:cell shape-determining protein MreC